MKRSKYGNRKVTKVSRDGKSETFDSQKEYLRHLVLLDMQKRGEIKKLKRQPQFWFYVNEQLICKYIGDWEYLVPGEFEIVADLRVVEDSKGFATAEFKLKWKLAKALYPEIDWRLS